jgi:hypothetical protein
MRKADGQYLLTWLDKVELTQAEGFELCRDVQYRQIIQRIQFQLLDRIGSILADNPQLLRRPSLDHMTICDDQKGLAEGGACFFLVAGRDSALQRFLKPGGSLIG